MEHFLIMVIIVEWEGAIGAKIEFIAFGIVIWKMRIHKRIENKLLLEKKL